MTTIGDMIKQKERDVQMYWKCTGMKQGDMHNSCDIKAYEKYSRVFGVAWGIVGQVDIHTGLSTGKRVEEPLVITKPIDKSTPSLLQAMIQNESIKDSEFIYLDFPGSKVQVNTMVKILTIKTENGHISKIEAGTTDFGAMIERISLHFDKITWRHEIANTEATDSRTDIT
jgi:type VI secretion system secreted protein Hcp